MSVQEPNEQGQLPNGQGHDPAPFDATPDSFGALDTLPPPLASNHKIQHDEGAAITPTEQANSAGKDRKDQDEDTQETDETSDAEEGEEEEDEDEEDRPMTLRDHFSELRKRLTICFVFAILGFAVCYPFAQEIFQFLVLPLDAALPVGSKFQYTAAHEAFFTFMKVAFVSGIFLTSPFIFYQVWSFIAPGLYDSEKISVIPVSIASAVFFIGGAAFCYYVVFPFAFEFFMQYTNDRIIAMPTLKESFGFVLQMLVAFGLVFELPLFVFFLARLGLITASWMRRMRRYAVLANVIIAAILTPPDVISQLLMAVPMLILYEFSIYIAHIFGKKTAPQPQKETENDNKETL